MPYFTPAPARSRSRPPHGAGSLFNIRIIYGQVKRQKEKAEMKRYLSFCALWIALWILPQLAGDWYDLRYNVYQAGISLILLVVSQTWLKRWWCPELGAVLVLQMLLNAGDALVVIDAPHYNDIQSVLNVAEVLILVGFGMPTEIYRMSRDKRRDNVVDIGHRAVSTKQGAPRAARMG